ncbi:MAG: hypothetical protein C4555_06530 [Dehalococcoidia bacterium]|nr:MAG: hypothetical protein C4555_06530 [Dehalococcoidia bacterium]
MIKQLVLLGLLILFLLSPGQPVMAADGQGKITGNLVNGTAAGSGVAGQELTLKIFSGDNQTGSITGVSDNNGAFEFDELDTDPALRYQVVLTYQQAEYFSPFLVFASEPLISTQVDVYDATTDPSVVSIAASHMVIYPESGLLFVREVIAFDNISDRTFIGTEPVTPGGKRETLRFSLPGGAVHFQAESGLVDSALLLTPSGVSDTMALLPGGKDVTYSYFVVSDTDTYDFEHQLNYPASGFNLLVQGQGASVTTSDLTRQTTVDMNGNAFQYFSGQGLETGKVISFSIAVQPGTAGGGEQAVLWLVVVLLVAAGGVAGYLVLRKRLSRAKASGHGETAEARLRELAQLDDDFEDGKISEEDYHRLRSEKKRQIAELLQRQRE